jgi:hypothetical protein
MARETTASMRLSTIMLATEEEAVDSVVASVGTLGDSIVGAVDSGVDEVVVVSEEERGVDSEGDLEVVGSVVEGDAATRHCRVHLSTA